MRRKHNKSNLHEFQLKMQIAAIFICKHKHTHTQSQTSLCLQFTVCLCKVSLLLSLTLRSMWKSSCDRLMTTIKFIIVLMQQSIVVDVLLMLKYSTFNVTIKLDNCFEMLAHHGSMRSANTETERKCYSVQSINQ